MVEIKLTVSDADKIDRIKKAFKGIYQIPLNDDETPKYSDGDWIKIKIIEFVKCTVSRWEQSEAQKQIALISTDNLIE